MKSRSAEDLNQMGGKRVVTEKSPVVDERHSVRVGDLAERWPIVSEEFKAL